MFTASPSYSDSQQQVLNSKYYWTYQSQGDDEDIEQYVNQSTCYSCTYRNMDYNGNGFFDRIEGSGQIALVWRQASNKETTYPSPISSDLGYKCSAAAPRRRVSSKLEICHGRNFSNVTLRSYLIKIEIHYA